MNVYLAAGVIVGNGLVTFIGYLLAWFKDRSAWDWKLIFAPIAGGISGYIMGTLALPQSQANEPWPAFIAGLTWSVTMQVAARFGQKAVATAAK